MSSPAASESAIPPPFGAPFAALGLTFDDVLLVPKRSSVGSRTAVTTGAPLTRRLNLAIPIISANMDTVTEAPMAIALAQLGGMGVIHKNLTIDEQAALDPCSASMRGIAACTFARRNSRPRCDYFPRAASSA